MCLDLFSVISKHFSTNNDSYRLFTIPYSSGSQTGEREPLGVREVHGGGTPTKCFVGGHLLAVKGSHLILPQLKVTLKPSIYFLQAKCCF